MAHILFGWELGANRGHLTRIVRYAAALRAAGHTVSIASQRIDGVAAEGGAGTVWQAPLWPRMLAWAAASGGGRVATMGDILARLGQAEPGVLAALIRGWEPILTAERPDIVIAEYAPALLMAARGRVPAIAIGVGFDLPPAGMAHFPSLTGAAALFDEAVLLDDVNVDLRATGRAPLDGLPGLFSSDRALPAGLDELDPYFGRRPGGMATPLIDRPLAPLGPAEGDEIFVYWPERGPPVSALWRALQRVGRPIRIHVPRLTDAQAADLARGGFAVERRPLPFGEIARRARLLVSHGGAGFVTNGLLHGRPQAVVHFDLEKQNNGDALDRLGVGGQVPVEELDEYGFANGLSALFEMPGLAERALGLAEQLRARMVGTAEDELLEAVAWLC